MYPPWTIDAHHRGYEASLLPMRSSKQHFYETNPGTDVDKAKDQVNAIAQDKADVIVKVDAIAQDTVKDIDKAMAHSYHPTSIGLID